MTAMSCPSVPASFKAVAAIALLSPHPITTHRSRWRSFRRSRCGIQLPMASSPPCQNENWRDATSPTSADPNSWAGTTTRWSGRNCCKTAMSLLDGHDREDGELRGGWQAVWRVAATVAHWDNAYSGLPHLVLHSHEPPNKRAPSESRREGRREHNRFLRRRLRAHNVGDGVVPQETQGATFAEQRLRGLQCS